jgi:hypothetical protein
LSEGKQRTGFTITLMTCQPEFYLVAVDSPTTDAQSPVTQSRFSIQPGKTNWVGRSVVPVESSDFYFINLEPLTARRTNPAVSRMHAQIDVAPNGDAWIQDANSTNGTFLAQPRPVDSNPDHHLLPPMRLVPQRWYQLLDQTTVRLGNVLLRFERYDPQKASAPPAASFAQSILCSASPREHPTSLPGLKNPPLQSSPMLSVSSPQGPGDTTAVVRTGSGLGSQNHLECQLEFHQGDSSIVDLGLKSEPQSVVLKTEGSTKKDNHTEGVVPSPLSLLKSCSAIQADEVPSRAKNADRTRGEGTRARESIGFLRPSQHVSDRRQVLNESLELNDDDTASSPAAAPVLRVYVVALNDDDITRLEGLVQAADLSRCCTLVETLLGTHNKPEADLVLVPGPTTPRTGRLVLAVAHGIPIVHPEFLGHVRQQLQAAADRGRTGKSGRRRPRHDDGSDAVESSHALGVVPAKLLEEWGQYAPNLLVAQTKEIVPASTIRQTIDRWASVRGQIPGGPLRGKSFSLGSLNPAKRNAVKDILEGCGGSVVEADATVGSSGSVKKGQRKSKSTELSALNQSSTAIDVTDSLFDRILEALLTGRPSLDEVIS